MASSEVKAKPGNDVTPDGGETLDFDDDTLRGKESFHFFARLSLTLNVAKKLSPRMIANGKWCSKGLLFLTY